MKTLENKGFSGGPTGARSRDLRIKRPHGQGPRNTVKTGPACTPVTCTEPTANQLSEKPGVRRGFWPASALSQRWHDLGTPPATRGAGWLSEATAHVRRHYPGDGLTESILYALHRVGFDLPPPPAEPEVVVQSDEDVFEPLRRVVGS